MSYQSKLKDIIFLSFYYFKLIISSNLEFIWSQKTYFTAEIMAILVPSQTQMWKRSIVWKKHFRKFNWLPILPILNR